MTDLSGRVDTLENQVTNLTQDMLQRPDMASFSTYQTSHEAEIAAISNNYATIKEQLRSVQVLYSTQFASYTTLNNTLTGHTGDATQHLQYFRFTVSDIQTGNYTGSVFETTLVDPTSSPMIVFPPNPTGGDQYRVKIASTLSALITLSGNSNLIEEPNSDYTFSEVVTYGGPGVVQTWEFDGASGWYII